MAKTDALTRQVEPPAVTYLIDSTNPATQKYVLDRARTGYFDRGTKLFWLDSTEPGTCNYPDQMRFHLGNGEPGVLSICGQDWDRIIWTIGAWSYYCRNGDREFLALALEAVTNSFRYLEENEWDLEFQLFRGGACIIDGVGESGPGTILSAGNEILPAAQKVAGRMPLKRL